MTDLGFLTCPHWVHRLSKMSHRQALDVLVMNYFKKLYLFPLRFAHINDENIYFIGRAPLTTSGDWEFRKVGTIGSGSPENVLKSNS